MERGQAPMLESPSKVDEPSSDASRGALSDWKGGYIPDMNKSIALRADGVEFGQSRAFLRKEREKKTYLVTKVLFKQAATDESQYVATVQELDYRRYNAGPSSAPLEDFVLGPVTQFAFTASPLLAADLVSFVNGEFGKPGMLYLNVVEGINVTWKYSPHRIEL